MKVHCYYNKTMPVGEEIEQLNEMGEVIVIEYDDSENQVIAISLVDFLKVYS